jgi:RNA polymerase sigma factor (TIGR02999 family)
MSGRAIPGDITALLSRWNAGDREALAGIAALAYDDLRAIAAGFLRRESQDHTLQATALVNELFLRLVQQKALRVEGREHFYTLAAMMMRRILTDHARRSLAQKRPQRTERIPLHDEIVWVDAAGAEMVELDRAMVDLETLDPRCVRAIELRFFLGCTIDEASEVLAISHATLERDVKFGLAWLYRRLSGAANG